MRCAKRMDLKIISNILKRNYLLWMLFVCAKWCRTISRTPSARQFTTISSTKHQCSQISTFLIHFRLSLASWQLLELITLKCSSQTAFHHYFYFTKALRYLIRVCAFLLLSLLYITYTTIFYLSSFHPSL